jgi:hypothetical protein
MKKDMDILNFWKSLFCAGVLGGVSFGGLLIVLFFYGVLSGIYAVCGLMTIIASVLAVFPVMDIFEAMEASIRKDSLKYVH